MSNTDFKKLIDEYNLDYCYFLEAVYGKGMMSEGGSSAIDSMFEGVDIEHKTALDIGSGLGGVGIYLAKKFSMNIAGIDINASMIREANQRIPAELTKKVSFQVYNDITRLPFANKQFHIVFSKGVLTHVKDKAPLFKEAHRILKTEGKFIINNWLSPVDNKWGARFLQMCEMENLTLYAVSEKTYQKIIEDAGFQVINLKDETANYASYNQELSNSLKEEPHATNFIEKFGEKSWKDAYEAYQLIADSMKDRELLVNTFVCILK